MNRSGRIALVFALGLCVLWVVLGQLGRPMLAADDTKARLDRLEADFKTLTNKVESMQGELKKLTGAGSSDTKDLQQKVQNLEKQVQSLQAHTHDMLQEGRGADGSVQAVRSEEFTARGLTATGATRIGRPVMR